MTDWCADRPYNHLPLLPPDVEVETRPILKQCIAAAAHISGSKLVTTDNDFDHLVPAFLSIDKIEIQ